MEPESKLFRLAEEANQGDRWRATWANVGTSEVLVREMSQPEFEESVAPNGLDVKPFGLAKRLKRSVNRFDWAVSRCDNGWTGRLPIGSSPNSDPLPAVTSSASLPPRARSAPT
jgi:hypothetical protein